MTATTTQFPVHTADSAPAGSQPLLEGAQKAFGFLPNLLGVFSESPAALEGYMTLSKLFGQTSFTPTEQQIVLIATSAFNGCTYCVAAHSTIAKGAKVPADVIAALRDKTPIADPKLQALRTFVEQVVENRGWANDAVQPFLNAGYTRQHVLEVILGVTMKTLSNYTNHLTETPLDGAFQPQAWTR